MYKCEIYNCSNKTNNVLCSKHEEEIVKEEVQVVMCNKCNSYVELREREEGKPKYHFLYGCPYCKDVRTDPPKLIPFKE